MSPLHERFGLAQPRTGPLLLAGLERRPWLTRPVEEVAVQVVPLNVLGQELSASNGIPLELPHRAVKLIDFCHVGAHDLAIHRALVADRARPAGLAHVLTGVQLVVSVHRAGSRIVVLLR